MFFVRFGFFFLRFVFLVLDSFYLSFLFSPRLYVPAFVVVVVLVVFVVVVFVVVVVVVVVVASGGGGMRRSGRRFFLDVSISISSVRWKPTPSLVSPLIHVFALFLPILEF